MDSKRLSASSIYPYNTMWSTGTVANGSGSIIHSTLVGGIRNGVTIQVVYDNDSIISTKIGNYKDGRKTGPVYSYNNGNMNNKPIITGYFYNGRNVNKEKYNKLITDDSEQEMLLSPSGSPVNILKK